MIKYVTKVPGKHEPDTYSFGFGLALKAYTVKTLKQILSEIPDDAYLLDIEYRKEFKDGALIFKKDNEIRRKK